MKKAITLIFVFIIAILAGRFFTPFVAWLADVSFLKFGYLYAILALISIYIWVLTSVSNSKNKHPLRDNHRFHAYLSFCVGLLVGYCWLTVLTFHFNPDIRFYGDYCYGHDDKIYNRFGLEICDDLLLPIKVDGKYGYINENGEVVIEPKYDYAGEFSRGLADVNIGGKDGYINKEGAIVVEPKYDEACVFYEDIARIKDDGKYGYINRKGMIVVEPKYDEADYEFSEGLARIKVDGKYGYIDKRGWIVVEPKYDNAYEFSEGLARIKIGRKYGYINKTGEIVVEPKYDDAYEFSEGLAAVAIKFDLDEYDERSLYGDGSGLIHIPFAEYKWGYINTDGEEVIKPQTRFTAATDFSEGLAAVGRYYYYGSGDGYIDKEGNYVIEPQFENAESFSEGLAAVEIGEYPNNKWGYINKDGEIVIEPMYDFASDFSEGLAAVRIGDYANDKWGCINKDGDVIVPIKYQWIYLSDIHDGWIEVKYKSYKSNKTSYKLKYGVYKADGTILLDTKYDRIRCFENRYFYVENGDNSAYIDIDGNWLWKAPSFSSSEEAEYDENEVEETNNSKSKSTNSNSPTYSYPAAPTYQDPYPAGGGYNGGYNTYESNTIDNAPRQKTKVRNDCPYCEDGEIIQHEPGRAATFGVDGPRVYCSKCNQSWSYGTVHAHNPCNYCKGRGYTEYEY